MCSGAMLPWPCDAQDMLGLQKDLDSARQEFDAVSKEGRVASACDQLGLV